MIAQDYKQQAAAAAKRFFQEGKQQSDATLAQRLNINSTLTSHARQGAVFWYAAQKLFLEAKAADGPIKTAFLKGALDLARRCQQELKLFDAKLPHLLKVQKLEQQCTLQLQNSQLKNNQLKNTAETESQSAGSDQQNKQLNTQLKTQLTATADVQEALKQLEARGTFKMPATSPLQQLMADMAPVTKDTLQGYFVTKQATTSAKLQYLPDDRLVKIIGLSAQAGLALDKDQRRSLQHFVHLQTIFETAQQVPDHQASPLAAAMLLTELERVSIDGENSFLQQATFIAVQLLLVRVRQWVSENQLDLEKVGLESGIYTDESAKISSVCFELGFAQVALQNKLELTLHSRAYFIGQGIKIAEEQQQDFWQDYYQFFAKSTMDLPSLVVLPSAYQLLVSCPEIQYLAQVAVDQAIFKCMHAKNASHALELFQVPENRLALKLIQLDQYQQKLAVANTMSAVNEAAILLFLTLSELGSDWPEMFTRCATIKSILRRKNLKLVWSSPKDTEHAKPVPLHPRPAVRSQTPVIDYWALQLRSELNKSWQNPFIPKAGQIAQFLRRFDF